MVRLGLVVFFFSSRRRHTRSLCDWSSDVCSSDLAGIACEFRFLEEALYDLVKSSLTSVDAVTTLVADLKRLNRGLGLRSEERRVGKECRSRWARCHEKKKRDGRRMTCWWMEGETP